jgi:hypothetical protein
MFDDSNSDSEDRLWDIEIIDERPAVTRFAALLDGRSATRSELFEGLSADEACRNAVTTCLVGLSADQIYWETPPLSRSTAALSAEFVAVTTTGLTRAPDAAAFREFFQPDQLVTSFSNLGGDAVLVAPTDCFPESRCSYLMPFLRSGQATQIHAVWAAVGREALRQLGDAPVWVSTSGGGVPWLHFRIESRPKYYSHDPYRR